MNILFRSRFLVAFWTLCLSCPLMALGQDVHINKLLPQIGGSVLAGNNEIRFVYADSSRIYVLGQGLKNDTLPCIFTAALSYAGSVIWKKNISIDLALAPSLKDGYHNLIKLPSGNMVAAGNLYHYPLSGGRVGPQPFLYFFNTDGDSLRFEVLADSSAQRLVNSLSLSAHGGGFIAAGSDSLLDYNGPFYDEYDSLENYWFARLDAAGDLQHLNKISMEGLMENFDHEHQDTIGWPRNIVKAVYPVAGDSVKYLIDIQRFSLMLPLGLNINVLADADFRWLGRYKVGFADGDERSTYYSLNDNRFISFSILNGYWLYATNFINAGVHNGKFRFYYSAPGVGNRNMENLESFRGSVLARFDAIPIEPPYGARGDIVHSLFLGDCTWCELLGQQYVTDTYQPLPHVEFDGFPARTREKESLHYAHLKQAVNGDLLVYKEVYLPVDSTAYPGVPYLTPFLFRANDSDGRVEWGMPLQLLPTKADSAVRQHIMDMSLAPSGCLVLGGYVNVLQPSPGYDSVGKNSWLMTLCDSLHDYSTPNNIPLSTVGKTVSMAIYPNPAINQTTLALQHFQGDLSALSWDFCDLNGRVLKIGKFKSLTENIDLRNYAMGTYLIRIFYNSEAAGIVKLVKY